MKKILTALLITFVSYELHAFQCYFTVVKDNCWKNYNVTVDLSDAHSGKKVVTVLVPQGSLWGRQPFPCEPGEILSYQAQFNPIFWANDEGKVYPGQRYWNLPKEIKSGESAWNITTCYGKDFSGLPLPPEATNNCQCDLKAVPPVEAA